MNRRRLLVLCGGGVASLAGCLGGAGGDGDGTTTDDGTPTGDGSPTDESPTGSGDPSGGSDGPLTVDGTADVDGGRVTVSAVHVQESFVHLTSPDSKGVTAEEQYLFTRVELDGVAPAVDAFEARVGDTETGASTPYGYRYMQADGEEVGAYVPEDGGGWLPFPLPESLAAQAGTVGLSVDGDWVGWTLPDEVLACLRRAPPAFELRSFVAERAGQESVRFVVSVENVADVDGTFRAAIDASGPGYAPLATARLDVEAGVSATWETTETAFGAAEGEHRFTLDWAGETRTRTVSFDDGTTTSG